MATTAQVGTALPLPAVGSRSGRRLVRGLLVAVLAAGVVLVGRTSGLLVGVPGLVAAAALVLAVPTSTDLNRRILLAGCLVLGWAQVLWWWPVPTAGLGRVTLALMLLAGGLGAWVGARPERRARRLLPRLTPVDAIAPLVAVLGAVCLGPWLRSEPPRPVLGVLLAGWDNVAHFSMVHMARRFGVTVDAMPPPAPGVAWQFASYPQGVHAAMTGVVELLVGPDLGAIGTELVAYTHAMALLVIAATVTVAGGLCALPPVRRRPALAAPAAALVAAVVYLGPGSLAIEGGIVNFLVACCLVVAVVLIVAPMARVVSPLPLAAAGGAVAGVAAGWALLLTLAVPPLLALLLPWRRSRWSASPLRWAGAAVVVAAVALCLARTVLVLSRVQVASPLTIDGGRVPVDLGVMVAAALGVVVACALLRHRVAAVAALPLVGAATTVTLVVMQVDANGKITYYGLKYLLGAEIVLLPVLVVPLVYLLDRHRRRRARLAGGVASVLGALALTQVFGLAVPGLAGIGLASTAPGVVRAEQALTAAADPPASSDLVSFVASTGRTFPPGGAYWIDMGSDGKVNGILAAQWFLALTDTWTLPANAVASRLAAKDPEQAVAVAQMVLRTRPDAVVVVRAGEAATLRQAVGPVWASRVVGL